MADEQQLALLKQGVDAWNHWRQQFPEIQPNLIGADLQGSDLGAVNFARANLHQVNLSGANLMGADLWQANLGGANLSGAYLSETDFSEADLTEADLSEAYLFEANLSRVNLNGANLQGVYLGKADLSGAYLIEANLREVDLRGANLIGTNLSDADLSHANLIGADMQGTELRRANLSHANLIGARLLKTNFEDANLTDCLIYGVSCWGVNLDGANQTNLLVNPPGEPAIAADNLEVAQFVYLLQQHKKIRQVLDTSPSQLVLILGHFTLDFHQELLNAIQAELRQRFYLPVVVDLEESPNQDLVDTITSLASRSRFILVDLTVAETLLPALEKLVQVLPLVPIQPLAQMAVGGEKILNGISAYPSVLPIHQYNTVEEAIANLAEKAIATAETKAKELNTTLFPSPV